MTGNVLKELSAIWCISRTIERGSNQFREIRTLWSTDTHWADLIGYENVTSKSVQLGIRGHWDRYLFKVFEGEHSLKLEFLINND